MIVLGIETSCDETAAAVVKNGQTVLSSVVASQIEIHHEFGGVVPEIAARKHLESIDSVVESAIIKSGLSINDIDAIAVTQGPGLTGALLVGFSFAKAFAFGRNLPFIGVNHLEGHINSVFLSEDKPEFPFTALLASGGHTSIYHVSSYTDYRLMGQTRDDAAGEAYDKVSKMLDLGYPGGRVIDELAKKGDREKIVFPRAWVDKTSYDFSFSGIKSAVRRYIAEHENYRKEIPHIVSGFQEAVVEVLVYKLIRAAVETESRHVAIAGGVAANSRLRELVMEKGRKKGLRTHIPPLEYCGDNAAMIAAAGFHRLVKGEISALEDDVYSRAKVPTGMKHR